MDAGHGGALCLVCINGRSVCCCSGNGLTLLRWRLLSITGALQEETF